MRVAIDVGGTFTDLVADDGNGNVTALKVPTTPSAPERGVIDALDALVQSGSPWDRIERIAHATTIATNALLGQMQLELPRVVLVTTDGFRDVIEIGRQNRSAVYDLFVKRPRPLVAREDRIGVRERLDYRGQVLLALDDAEIARVVEAVRRQQPEAIAIGFLHSYANDVHERRVADALTAAFPDLPIARSSDVDPEYREYERFSTTVVDAVLLPIVRRYLDELRAELARRAVAAPLFVMRSNGGMATGDVAAAHPAALLESGPAGGAIAAAALARRIGARNVLSFDMGGTTAKAATILDGRVQFAAEFEAAGATHSGRSVTGSGYPVRFPFVDLAEISAGGGTIAWIDDIGALRVGPLSAGADPGPACYGRSDRATVTDANVVLGRLPQTHLLGGTFPIDAQRSRAAIAALARQLDRSVEGAATGILALIDAQMARVLRMVTVERGLDPRDFSLVAFGGNGPLHACSLATDLSIARIVVPARPGLFSAEGLLAADLRATAVHAILRDCDDVGAATLAEVFAMLERRARIELHDQGTGDESIEVLREVDARYRGQSFELTIDGEIVGTLAQTFHAAHEKRYGYAARGERVEIVNARITASASLGTQVGRPGTRIAESRPATGARDVWIDGMPQVTSVYARDHLATEAVIVGPALIEQYDAVTYIAHGWTASVAGDELLLTRRE
ncbi:MAG TPA: hydantoinase/oxoprolinase family protein [Verrucomicrobiae bacterium]|jgi:N-methylhydantoinase A|nr:hydantoinase/oxoprolinase family protein [Verrucomicrobiae bacterium]